MNSNSSML